MLSLSSRIITVHCLKVSLPMKSTAWLQKENSLRILMMTLHYRIMPRQHDSQRRILMMICFLIMMILTKEVIGR